MFQIVNVVSNRGASPRPSGPLLRMGALCVLVGTTLGLGGWTGAQGQSRNDAPTAPSAGKSLTALEPSGNEGEWHSLDPRTSTVSTNLDYLDAIYGNLFEIAKGGRIVPDLATGYKFSNAGKTVTIYLRPGVQFSDGTPLNAQAVEFNIQRDLAPGNTCNCAPSFPITSIATPNATTVVISLSQAEAPMIDNFYQTAPNFIASPTAVNKLGTQQFALTPVGAGPFEVVSDQPNSKLVLRRNPHYWQKGRPHLSTLTFLPIGTDESAYEALVANNAQAYQAFSTYSLLKSVRSPVRATEVPASNGAQFVQLNTTAAPFDNPIAREALYYATDPTPINRSINLGKGTVVQSATSPGGSFYQPKVPGYRQYNLAKAKALVKQLGGLHIALGVLSGQSSELIGDALKAQWARAGIAADLTPYPITPLIQYFHSNKWQAIVQGTSGFSPALRAALPFRFQSNGAFTGVKDPQLDQLINSAAATLNTGQQAKIYREIWTYINQKAYAPMLFALPTFNLTVKSVSGPGLTNGSYIQVLWQDVSVK